MRLEVTENLVIVELADGRMIKISDYWAYNQHGIAVTLPNGTYKSGEHHLIIFDKDLGFPSFGNDEFVLERIDDSWDV